MRVDRDLVQHVAGIGQRRRGRTVHLSSFYGATQPPKYAKEGRIRVVADDIGQGDRLHRDYLRMRDSARLPALTKFAPTSYPFSVRFGDRSDATAARRRQPDSLRLVGHDYPGKRPEPDASGAEAEQRRTVTFESLLGSDITLLMVDVQRLLDNSVYKDHSHLYQTLSPSPEAPIRICSEGETVDPICKWLKIPMPLLGQSPHRCARSGAVQSAATTFYSMCGTSPAPCSDLSRDGRQ